MRGDSIRLYIEEVGPEKVRISDFGDILAEFDTLGFDYLTPKRKRLVNEIASRNSVKIEDGSIELVCNRKDAQYAINSLVSAITSLNHLIFLETPIEEYDFSKEVYEYLLTRHISTTPKDRVEYGGVGFKIDMRIPDPTKRSQGKLIQTFFVEDRAASLQVAVMKTYPFVFFHDKKAKFEGISVVNEFEEKWGPKSKQLIRGCSRVFDWTEKDELVEALV